MDEGLVGLNEPVETYLPGLLRGEGIDGRAVTVRQLLQHNSGLPNYTYFLQGGLLPYLHNYKQPRELLDLALARPASFAPGASWEYSNTNFLVTGLVVEAVTDRPLAEQVTERVIEPLGVERTNFPGVGEQELRGDHPQAYHNDDPAQPLTDVTVQDPSFGWAAGQMVSTSSEVNRFFTALLDGELLAPEQLEQMRTTVPTTTDGEGLRAGPDQPLPQLRRGRLGPRRQHHWLPDHQRRDRRRAHREHRHHPPPFDRGADRRAPAAVDAELWR